VAQVVDHLEHQVVVAQVLLETMDKLQETQLTLLDQVVMEQVIQFQEVQ
jgi:hypothetical protein